MDGEADTGRCPSCGAQADTRYCADCGQDQRPVMRRWRSYAEELVSSVLDLDSSIFQTYWTLVLQPGRLSFDKVQNRARDLVTPLKLFFVTVVFYGLFFGLSPIHYGQLRFGTEGELYEIEGSDAPDWEFMFFSPEIGPEQVVQPELRAILAAGGPADISAARRARLATLARDEAAATRFQDRFSSMVPYGVLGLIVPVIGFGLVFCRRRYVIEHVFIAFEATTAYLVLTLLTGVGVFVLRLSGLVVDEFAPFLLFTLPVFLVWLALALRGFYRLKRRWAAAAAFAIVLVFAIIDEIVTIAFAELALASVPAG